MPGRLRKILLWFAAIVVTLTAAVYQRMTGPTYPVRGAADIGGTVVPFRLLRSAENIKDCEIAVKTADPAIIGFLEYKRFKTEDPWTRVELARTGEKLAAFLPKQPQAGKLAYRVVLAKNGRETSLTGDRLIVIRFKGVVPNIVQIPHILIMFLAMLLSTVTGLFALSRTLDTRKLVFWTCLLLFVGGFILGPLMQSYGFGKFWTGIPFGTDLTDNKTLIAMIAWAAALIAGRKGKNARGWVLAAAVILLLVYSIPHSLLGSELDYSKLPQ